MVPLAGQEWSDVSNFLSQGLSLSVRDSLMYTGGTSGSSHTVVGMVETRIC